MLLINWFQAIFMARVVVVDRELCNFKKCQYPCMKACPKNRSGEKCITIGSDKFPEINEDLCIGCGLCVKKCDFSALNVINLPEALDEKPIIQFGPNSFRLFRLPVPSKGVVGLMGENGTGKTTALRILSGGIKPNLGKFTEDVAWKEIIRTYRGNELQQYLERLSEGKLKTVYKPQQVDLLPKRFPDLDGLKIREDFFIRLGIDKEKKELKNLSGGELQKISIAHTLSQDADIYYLDEPSNFLDVRERLRVAKFIQEFSLGKMVMVVEHDLATLDFMADNIHIFYGKPGSFGVVSKTYAVKNGINSFLSGFVKEDNVRISEPITFESSFMQKKCNEVLTSFGAIEKHLGDFRLEVGAGTIYRGEVLGIFGSNALGKTTFAKILAGQIESDAGIDNSVRISYKPQYLSTIEFTGSVYDMLSAIKDPSDQEFRLIIRKTDVERLLMKTVSRLSGGELQRVAIAACLGRDADLYLLDEPTAYLDVGQRMSLAKYLKNAAGKTFLVIDHDIMFLSYLADRCLLFSGESGKYGKAEFYSLKEGMNRFLKDLGITFRRDEETKRLKANKPDSVKDREQKEKGDYFEV